MLQSESVTLFQSCLNIHCHSKKSKISWFWAIPLYFPTVTVKAVVLFFLLTNENQLVHYVFITSKLTMKQSALSFQIN